MVENLSVQLQKEGFEVEIISLYSIESPILRRLEKKGFKVIKLNKKLGLDMSIVVKLFLLFLKNKPDVIHTHLHSLKYAVFGSTLARIPIRIHTIHSVAEKDANITNRLFNKIFFNWFSILPVSISPQVKETILETYSLKKNQVPMIYNGVNVNDYSVKTKYCIDKKTIRIIHIGNFKEAKNHIGILNSISIVCESYPNVELELIGSGVLKDKIKAKAFELSIQNKIKFLGEQTNINDRLISADIFILPSLWEGMPISLIEAMASGLPIVATDVGGIPDMIKNNENGVLVRNNPSKIAQGIITLIENESLRETLGRNAVLSSRKYTAKIMAKAYSELYLSNRKE